MVLVDNRFTTMKVCNIKLTAYFKHDLFVKKKSSKKKIFKEGLWTVIVYYHTPKLLNITGLKQKTDIEKVISRLEDRFNNTCLKHQIDSVMISHKDTKLIKMDSVVKVVEKTTPSMYYIDFHPELFTGMYLKPRVKGYPTINLFYTGSFQLLGGNDFKKIDESTEFIQLVIKKCENGVF